MPRADVVIEAVDRLRLDLHRHTDAGDSIRQAAHTAAHRVRSSVTHALGEARAHSRRASEALDRAYTEERLRQERATASRDGGYDPWGRFDRPVDLDAARRTMRAAEADVERVRTVQQQIERHLDEMLRAVADHAQATALHVQQASALLERKRRELEDYWAHHANVVRAMGGAALGESGYRSPGATLAENPSETPVADGLPDGFSWVAVSDIDDSDTHVTGAAQFLKGYSIEDLEWAHHALRDVVLPTLARGGTVEDLRSRDMEEERQGTRSYADTYAGFLRDGAIKLEQGSNGLVVTNGLHRIFVARQAGISHVVAKVRA